MFVASNVFRYKCFSFAAIFPSCIFRQHCFSLEGFSLAMVFASSILRQPVPTVLEIFTLKLAD